MAEKSIKAYERELAQHLMYLQEVQGMMETIAKEHTLLEAKRTEHLIVQDTLRRYKDAKEGTEMLIPIGAGSYLHAKATNTKLAILGIGAGYAIEQPVGNALKMLEARVKNIEEREKKLEEAMESYRKQASMLSARVQEIYRDLQELLGKK